MSEQLSNSAKGSWSRRRWESEIFNCEKTTKFLFIGISIEAVNMTDVGYLSMKIKQRRHHSTSLAIYLLYDMCFDGVSEKTMFWILRFSNIATLPSRPKVDITFRCLAAKGLLWDISILKCPRIIVLELSQTSFIIFP